MRVPVSSWLHQPFLLSIFSILTILVGVKWYHFVLLICVSLMAYNIEHLHVPIVYLFIFIGEMSVQSHCSFGNWVICYFIVNLSMSFIYSGCKSLDR